VRRLIAFAASAIVPRERAKYHGFGVRGMVSSVHVILRYRGARQRIEELLHTQKHERQPEELE